MKAKVVEFIEQERENYISAAKYIWENPEIGHQEFKAQKLLVELLEKGGFEVEKGVAGMDTAFIARSGGLKPSVAFLAEYDALPGLGHACGHNLIGVMAVAAGISLKKFLPPEMGSIMVIGSPAEETDGGKVAMVKDGVFDEVDIALMAHPSTRYQKSGHSLGLETLQFDFFGSSAHASSAPEKGINALDGAINTYVSISNLRQQVKDGARIHGVITKGGEAANIIPEHARLQYYVRAREKEELDKLVEMVKACAEGGAKGAGCRLKISNYETGYAALISNKPLNEKFCSNLVFLGVSLEDIKEGNSQGSVDIGDVSQVVPAIHPYVKITENSCAGHTRDFAIAAKSQEAMKGMLLGAKALALTALDYFFDENLKREIGEDFAKNK